MNREEIETFKRAVGSLKERYDNVLVELQIDYARQNDVPSENVNGRDIALEAHVRAYLIDPILHAVGWETELTTTMVIEDGVAPVEEDTERHRRRLDYHGRENRTGRSLLVVESKRASVKLPQSDDGDLAKVFAAALKSDKATPKVPFSAEWSEILSSASDYSRRVVESYGQAPTRFAITNGEWFTIFKDVNSTLLADTPEPMEILVFKNLDEVIVGADQFCDLLGYHNLSGYIPPQHPGALAEYIPVGQKAVCARVVDIHYGRHGNRQPILSMRIGIWVRTPKGVWILFQKQYEKDFLLLSDHGPTLRTSLSELNARARELLKDLRAHRRIRFADQSEFEEAPPPQSGSILATRSTALLEKLEHDRYRLVTSDKVHHLVNDSSYNQCPSHDWGTCRSQGNAAGQNAVAAQSCEPPCFFVSGM
jgi:hypothetical protein